MNFLTCFKLQKLQSNLKYAFIFSLFLKFTKKTKKIILSRRLFNN